MAFFGTVSGGLSAELTGGNFWQGAATGLVVSGLNHTLHRIDIKNDFKDFLKEYYAIVAGESSNNSVEAQGIGELMLRRMALVGANFDGNFIEQIGGSTQFDAIGGKIYNEIKAMTLRKIENLDYKDKYWSRIEGAKNAIFSNSNVSNGAYFWNASNPQTGLLWKTYNRGTFEITAELGDTTFFKYTTNTNKSWP